MIKIYLFPRILNSWTYFITKLIISLFSLYNYKLQIRNNFVICNFDTANNFNEYFIGINFQDLNKKLSYFYTRIYSSFVRSILELRRLKTSLRASIFHFIPFSFSFRTYIERNDKTEIIEKHRTIFLTIVTSSRAPLSPPPKNRTYCIPDWIQIAVSTAMCNGLATIKSTNRGIEVVSPDRKETCKCQRIGELSFPLIERSPLWHCIRCEPRIIRVIIAERIRSLWSETFNSCGLRRKIFPTISNIFTYCLPFDCTCVPNIYIYYSNLYRMESRYLLKLIPQVINKICIPFKSLL